MGGQMQAASPLITLSPTSPSFNSYSSGKFAEIAARVVQEFSSDTSSDIFSWTTNAADDDPAYEQFDPHVQDNSTHRETKAEECLNEEDDEEEEFEFAVVSKEADTYDASSTVADDIFYNGQIRPIYPLFNTSLISSDDINQAEEEKSSTPPKPKPKPKRPQLRKLFSEERDTASSCSSSEADELDGAPPGTYCVWAPKKKSEEEEKATRVGCKKSRSTGSKRWKIKDLLLHSRSNSDGKESFVLLTPPPPPPPTTTTTTKKGEKEGKNDNNKLIKEINNTKGKEGKLGAAVKVSAAVEVHDVIKSKDGGGDAKRRSYLPYRQDLVGFLSNVNGLGRNLRPF